MGLGFILLTKDYKKMKHVYTLLLLVMWVGACEETPFEPTGPITNTSTVDVDVDVNIRDEPEKAPDPLPPLPPTLNSPPTITSPGDQSSKVGESVSLLIVCTDPDGDTLTFSMDNAPRGLTIGELTGLVTGAATSSSLDDSPFATTFHCSGLGGSAGVGIMWDVVAIPLAS